MSQRLHVCSGFFQQVRLLLSGSLQFCNNNASSSPSRPSCGAAQLRWRRSLTVSLSLHFFQLHSQSSGLGLQHPLLAEELLALIGHLLFEHRATVLAVEGV